MPTARWPIVSLSRYSLRRASYLRQGLLSTSWHDERREGGNRGVLDLLQQPREHDTHLAQKLVSLHRPDSIPGGHGEACWD